MVARETKMVVRAEVVSSQVKTRGYSCSVLASSLLVFPYLPLTTSALTTSYWLLATVSLCPFCPDY
jgi:hypothetical protein